MRDSSQFNPQIAALAMPDGSEVSAVANGITNIGKVFVDAEAQQSASALNALKMEEANQSIIAKKNENSVFSEEQSRKKETHLLEKRNKTLEGLKKEIEWKADVKKQTDNGFMDKFKQLVPSQTFIDPATGKFSDDLASKARTQFKSKGGWADANIHLFDGLVDGYRKESLESGKMKSEIASKEATTKKTALEAQTVIPESKAKIAQNTSAANLNNVRAALEPEKVSTDTRHKRWLETKGDSGTNGDLKTVQGRQNHIALGRMKNLLPDYDSLTGTQQIEVNKIFVEKGVLPKKLQEVDGQYQAVYPSGTLVAQPKAVQSKVPKTPPAQKKSLFQQSLDAGQ